jgi:hypothetical protein
LAAPIHLIKKNFGHQPPPDNPRIPIKKYFAPGTVAIWQKHFDVTQIYIHQPLNPVDYFAKRF